MEEHKKLYKNNKLQYQQQHGMKSLKFLMDLIPYHIYLQLLATEIIKLLGSTEQIITKDKNGENVPRQQIN